MNSKIFFSLFILAFLTTGCISEYNAELPSSDLQILFVDGSIIENSNVKFYLSKSVPLNSASVSSGNINANLSIIGSNGYESLPAINLGKGEYILSVGELDNNVEYGIQIEYEGDIYQSTLAKPLHTPEIDSVSWVQPEEKGNVFFRVSTHDDTGKAKFFLWDYVEDWEFTAYYKTTCFYDPVRRSFYEDLSEPYFYCWKNNKSKKYFIGSTESLSENRIINKQIYTCYPGNDRFFVLYSVNVQQKAISKSAFEYYQNKIVMNEEMGGLFTPQPSEMTGNITCITDPSKKVMGYVEAVKNVTEKRKFVYPNQITRPTVSSDCTTISSDSIMSLFPRSEYPNPYVAAYEARYRPVGDLLFTIENIPWTIINCVECTANGGSKKKPDFWPNDHE